MSMVILLKENMHYLFGKTVSSINNQTCSFHCVALFSALTILDVRYNETIRLAFWLTSLS